MDNSNAEYYRFVRFDLIRDIPQGLHRVLEVGCAEGATGATLKNNGCAREVVGIELNPDAANVASARLDKVICADVETVDFSAESLDEGSFDYIICGDVLEHLKDPWYQLGRLLTLLKSGGKFIVSLPNIRYYGIVFPLLFHDDFEYRSSGILDQTHLRFFTKSTSIKMLTGAGLTGIYIEGIRHKRRDKLLFSMSAGFLAGFVSSQWLIVGTKPS